MPRQMTRLHFLLARTLRNESALQRLSISQPALLATLTGRKVALIGNARALAATNQGAQIDAADLIIRINRAPMPAARSHGTRTDWLALATRLPAPDRARLSPDRLLWMSPKRKRLDWQTATSPGFYLHPLPDYAALKTHLTAPPTTGAMLIDLLLRSSLNTLTLHGFDFFASNSLSGRRTATEVPHNFTSESAWVQTRQKSDPRLTLIPPTA